MSETVTESKTDLPKGNFTLGIITSLIGAVLGMGVATLLFLRNYELYIAEEIKICPVGCEHIITWFMPAYTDMAVIGGVLSLFSAWGLYKKEAWAFKTMMAGNIIMLKFSFWPLIPAMDIGIFPEYLYLFMPTLLLFVVNTFLVIKAHWGRIITSMILGMSAVTGFMSGTSATNMYMKTMFKIENAGIGVDTTEWWNQIELYMLVQRLGWLSGIILLILTYAVLFFPKEKIRLMGIAAGLIVLIYEVPLAALITELKGEFSMMYYGPILILMYMPIFLVPSLWAKFLKPVDQ